MNVFWKLLFGLLLSVLGFVYYQGWLLVGWNYPLQFKSPLANSEVKVDARLLDGFAFEELMKRNYESSPIVLEKVLERKKDFTSYLFSYQSDGRKVTGMANIPLLDIDGDKLPVIVMLRGYVDREIYETGIGTRNAAQVFAENGFVTLAPDFLGYGGSDMPDDDVFWERFNRPVQVLNLLASLGTLVQVDVGRVGIWGHSNGGQVAMSVLEISGKNYPTVLWAPVSKPFPYSILYYTDEFDDEGKRLRFEVAKMERLYDVRKYSITEYFDLIKAPIQLHQGTVDEAVPLEWLNELIKKLRSVDVDLNYFVYPNAGHNMEGSWNTVVARDVKFYRSKLMWTVQDLNL